ncbi:nucleotidyltransferase [Bacteroidia bacterium]|nr:nucleotidyltransferase [Bacteroidia bacterium]
MNKNNFINLPAQNKINAFAEAAARKALPAVAIEKDWWVTAVLRALFSLPYAENLSFKGGTSLSKCYNLIERFSEDIDIAVNREKPDLTKTPTRLRNDLRRSTCKFVREELQFDVAKALENQGINSDLFSANVNITPITTTDPEIVEIVYQSLFEDNDYIKPVVKIEFSGRSMSEPLQTVKLQSILDEVFGDMSFTNPAFEANAVVPERTFLEKIFLLHEEFAKPQELIRTERMSRHLYDLERIMNTETVEKALNDNKLYNSIVEHRRIFIGLGGFDYSTLAPQTINILPPESVITQWQQDYETMQKTMIYGKSLTFDKLLKRIEELQNKIRNAGESTKYGI